MVMRVPSIPLSNFEDVDYDCPACSYPGRTCIDFEKCEFHDYAQQVGEWRSHGS